jgi:hypothetical protein
MRIKRKVVKANMKKGGKKLSEGEKDKRARGTIQFLGKLRQAKIRKNVQSFRLYLNPDRVLENLLQAESPATSRVSSIFLVEMGATIPPTSPLKHPVGV